VLSYLPLNIMLRRRSVRYGALAGVITGAAGTVLLGPWGLLLAPPAAYMTGRAILFRKRRAGARRWQDRHLEFVRIARAGDVDALFIGDCLTERWSSAGAPAWHELVSDLNAENFGLEGDSASQLLWRLQDGELDSDHAPSVVVIWTGTNNVTFGEKPEAIAQAIGKVVTSVLEATDDTHVLLLAIPPRGWKPSASRTRVEQANALIADDFRDHGRVTFIDPKDVLVERDGTIERSVMYDGMHLTAEGYERVARLLAPAIDRARFGDRVVRR
jgi:lysophospholipase L1-like esterase